MISKNRLKSILAFTLLLGPAILLIVIGTRSCEHNFEKLDDFGNLKNYSFYNIDGKKKSSEDFKNSIVILTTLQQSCPRDCALSFWALERHIYQQIRKNRKKLNSVRLISYVVDANGNPVKDLGPISDILKSEVDQYDPELWILASGDSRSIYNIKHNNVNLLEKGDQYYGGESFHELMLLIDKNNHLRMVLNGNSEGMIRRMKQSLALLLKQYDKEK